VRGGDDRLRDAGVEEREQGLVVGEQVAPARAVLELLHLLQAPAVLGEERVARLPVALHERRRMKSSRASSGSIRP
jgi:hypothetical protein